MSDVICNPEVISYALKPRCCTNSAIFCKSSQDHRRRLTLLSWRRQVTVRQKQREVGQGGCPPCRWQRLWRWSFHPSGRRNLDTINNQLLWQHALHNLIAPYQARKLPNITNSSLPSKTLTLDLMESLDLVFRRACYHQNASNRKMKRLEVVEQP
jgi:hypothetical protein